MLFSIKAAREVVAQVKLSYGDDLTDLSLPFLQHRLWRMLGRLGMRRSEDLLARLRQGDPAFYADFFAVALATDHRDVSRSLILAFVER